MPDSDRLLIERIRLRRSTRRRAVAARQLSLMLTLSVVLLLLATPTPVRSQRAAQTSAADFTAVLDVSINREGGLRLITFTADRPLPGIQSWHDRQGFHLMLTGTTGWRVRQPPADIVLNQRPDSLEFILPLDWDARAIMRSDATTIELAVGSFAAGRDRPDAKDFTPPARATRPADDGEQSPYRLSQPVQPAQPAQPASSTFFEDLARARQSSTIAPQQSPDDRQSVANAPQLSASQSGGTAAQVGTVVIPEVATGASTKLWVLGFAVAVLGSIAAALVLSKKKNAEQSEEQREKQRKVEANPRVVRASHAAERGLKKVEMSGVAEAIEAVIAENNVKPRARDVDKPGVNKAAQPATTAKKSSSHSFGRMMYDTAECAALKEFINHYDPAVRVAAARTLAAIATPDAVMLLINFLNDTHVLVRDEAANILCRLRDTTQDGDEVRELIRNEEGYLALLTSPHGERRHKERRVAERRSGGARRRENRTPHGSRR